MRGVSFFRELVRVVNDGGVDVSLIDNIKSWFSKKEEAEETEQPESEEEAEEPEPPRRQLPEKISVPWPVIVKVYNFQELKKKTHSQIKDFLYEKTIQERALFDKIKLIEEKTEEEVEKISKLFGIDDLEEYDLFVPNTPGNPGSLVKVKKGSDPQKE